MLKYPPNGVLGRAGLYITVTTAMELAAAATLSTVTNTRKKAVGGLKLMRELVDNVKSTAVAATMVRVTTTTVTVMRVAMATAKVRTSVIAAAMTADAAELRSADMAVSAGVAASTAAVAVEAMVVKTKATATAALADTATKVKHGLKNAKATAARAMEGGLAATSAMMKIEQESEGATMSIVRATVVAEIAVAVAAAVMMTKAAATLADVVIMTVVSRPWPMPVKCTKMSSTAVAMVADAVAANTTTVATAAATTATIGTASDAAEPEPQLAMDGATSAAAVTAVAPAEAKAQTVLMTATALIMNLVTLKTTGGIKPKSEDAAEMVSTTIAVMMLMAAIMGAEASATVTTATAVELYSRLAADPAAAEMAAGKLLAPMTPSAAMAPAMAMRPMLMNDATAVTAPETVTAAAAAVLITALEAAVVPATAIATAAAMMATTTEFVPELGLKRNKYPSSAATVTVATQVAMTLIQGLASFRWPSESTISRDLMDSVAMDGLRLTFCPKFGAVLEFSVIVASFLITFFRLAQLYHPFPTRSFSRSAPRAALASLWPRNWKKRRALEKEGADIEWRKNLYLSVFGLIILQSCDFLIGTAVSVLIWIRTAKINLSGELSFYSLPTAPSVVTADMLRILRDGSIIDDGARGSVDGDGIKAACYVRNNANDANVRESGLKKGGTWNNVTRNSPSVLGPGSPARQGAKHE